ncbi:MAG TPA: hypothetical protein VNK82_03915 [Terriglobales bacterium]|nr:hypothetical protein [Terriglobales bacterium]
MATTKTRNRAILFVPLFLGLCALTAASKQPGQAAIPIEQFLKQRVHADVHKNIFIVFAFLNAAGYDFENTEHMHPVRVAVRKEVDASLPAALRERMRTYFRERQVSPANWTYAIAAVAMGPPPSFEYGPEWNEVKNQEPFRQIDDLPVMLREFYGAVPVERIWAEQRPEYERTADEYRDAVYREARRAMDYCRVRTTAELAGSGETKEAVIIPNLLDSYETATSFIWGGAFHSVEGPQYSVGYNPHEFIHAITNPSSYSSQYSRMQEKARPLYELSKQTKTGKDLKSLQSFLDENLVRAISLRYLRGDDKRRLELRNAMMQEYRAGYTMERFFYDELEQYERSKKSLREFYPTFFKRLNAHKEVNEWKKQQQ